MNKDSCHDKKFLEEQLQWCKQQDCILEEMEKKLYEMKRLAEYALEQQLTASEVADFNERLKQLKEDINFLNKQSISVAH